MDNGTIVVTPKPLSGLHATYFAQYHAHDMHYPAVHTRRASVGLHNSASHWKVYRFVLVAFFPRTLGCLNLPLIIATGPFLSGTLSNYLLVQIASSHAADKESTRLRAS